MDSTEIEKIIAYVLGRWLRKGRCPGDARIGAGKIVRQLRLSGIRFQKNAREKPPKTPAS